jgi:hypothetical protein
MKDLVAHDEALVLHDTLGYTKHHFAIPRVRAAESRQKIHKQQELEERGGQLTPLRDPVGGVYRYALTLSRIRVSEWSVHRSKPGPQMPSSPSLEVPAPAAGF